MKGSKDAIAAQVGNIKIAAMLTDKGLEAHPDKTCFIVCGSKKYKEKAEQDLMRNPLKFGQFLVKQKEYDKYLGQVLHGGGLEQSAEATVQERSGRIRGATMEIKTIVEEFQMQAIGGMMAAWELWERAIIPSLLSGAGTWFGGKECTDAIKLCDQLQNFYWRVMLRVPESCPKIALRCETRMTGMKWRIWQEKILLLMRIKNQDEGSLCRQVYEEGRAKGWPGLGKEVTEICRQLGIPDVNSCCITKDAVKKAIYDHHYMDLKKELEGSQKLQEVKNENFREVQEYFKDKSIENSRMAFKVRCKMVPDIPGNFSSKYKKQGEQGLVCTYCQEGEIMSQSHCLECPAWEDLREGLELSKISDMVKFFRNLLKERAKLEAGNV